LPAEAGDTKTVYVRCDSFVSDNWPNKINSFEIKYLRGGYCKTISASGGSMTLVGISALELVNGEFYVVVIPFRASCDKKTVHLSNGGGLTVYFEYDSELKRLVFKSKEWSGI